MTRPSVVFAPNWLGDAVMAPASHRRLLRARHDRPIDIAARASIAPLVPLIPGICRAVVSASAPRASPHCERATTAKRCC